MSVRIGLYFGSFNPIHNGHIEVAHYMKSNAPFDEIWFVPSPLNPHKSGETLIPSDIRLSWVQDTIATIPNFSCKDDEFKLSLPSYTYKSLLHFTEFYPQHSFGIIMGADNLHGFHTWQNAKELSELAPLHVYARPGYEKPPEPMPFGANWHDAPLIDISATQIRDLLWKGESINELVPSEISEKVKLFFQSKKNDSKIFAI